MFWPGLKPHQTRIIWMLLAGKQLPTEDEKERENLREWFEHEVDANAAARRNQTGV